jgi:type III pantothenate kinase|tara:strand:+ start:7064 stop:7810 length:747 start_codon:yes stop_codon:yes gene_type:complete
MKIIGDIGNTEVKICLVDNKFKIKKKIFVKTNEINQSNLKKNLKFLLKYKNNLESIVFSSVAPKIYKKFSIFFKSNLNKKIIEIKNFNLNKLIDIRVNKNQVGSDRLANSIAATDSRNNYIIIDFGTATTFDVLIKKKYLGGIISPGIKLSLNTLTSSASLIPEINLKKISNVIGKNTLDAVRSGFFWGYAGLIDNMIKLIKRQTKSAFKIILTGGLAELYKNSINTKCKVDKDLTIKGIIKITKNFI